VIPTAIPLQTLPAGQSASILQILGRPDDVHRLEEFGLLCGTQVEMFRSGNPCIIRVAGNKIGLRANDVLRVIVEPLLLKPKEQLEL
jgi:Fe2+ transport system protein FeoA